MDLARLVRQQLSDHKQDTNCPMFLISSNDYVGLKKPYQLGFCRRDCPVAIARQQSGRPTLSATDETPMLSVFSIFGIDPIRFQDSYRAAPRGEIAKS